MNIASVTWMKQALYFILKESSSLILQFNLQTDLT